MGFETPVMPAKKSETVELFGSLEASEQFPGSKIISVRNGDRTVRYALRRGADGTLEGNEFEVQEYRVVAGGSGEGSWVNSSSNVDASGQLEINGKTLPKYRLGPTYQISADKLQEIETSLKEKGIQI